MHAQVTPRGKVHANVRSCCDILEHVRLCHAQQKFDSQSLRNTAVVFEPGKRILSDEILECVCDLSCSVCGAWCLPVLHSVGDTCHGDLYLTDNGLLCSVPSLLDRLVRRPASVPSPSAVPRTRSRPLVTWASFSSSLRAVFSASVLTTSRSMPATIISVVVVSALVA
jgi:hypothetical protein